MAQNKVDDFGRTEQQEIAVIQAQLDRWKVPKRHSTLGGGAGVRMSTLARIRFMRNQAVATVNALTAERNRLQRLLDEKDRRLTAWLSSESETT